MHNPLHSAAVRGVYAAPSSAAPPYSASGLGSSPVGRVTAATEPGFGPLHCTHSWPGCRRLSVPASPGPCRGPRSVFVPSPTVLSVGPLLHGCPWGAILPSVCSAVCPCGRMSHRKGVSDQGEEHERLSLTACLFHPKACLSPPSPGAGKEPLWEMPSLSTTGPCWYRACPPSCRAPMSVWPATSSARPRLPRHWSCWVSDRRLAG